MRLFVAVEISEPGRGAALDLIARLRATAARLAPQARITWVTAERLHVTIRFIGHVDDRRPTPSRRCWRRRLREPFDLTIAGVGTFPPKGGPRVIWAGLTAGRRSTLSLERIVSERLAQPVCHRKNGHTTRTSRWRACATPPDLRVGVSSGRVTIRARDHARRRDYTVREPAVAKGTDVRGAATYGAASWSLDMNAFIAIVCGYIIGSVPFAFLLARREGVDLRASGSGNVGASNVMRTTGLSMGVLAMMLDSIKGVVSVLLAERIATASIAPVAAGLASMLGHVYPPWLRFRGGKGVATAAGAFAVLAPAAATAASLVFIISVVATRIISVGSVNAAVTLVIVTMLARSSGAVIAGAVVAAAIILFRHRSNIARIVAGTERRVGGV